MLLDYPSCMAAAKSRGSPYGCDAVFPDLLLAQVYRLYSELISQAIAAGGANAAR